MKELGDLTHLFVCTFLFYLSNCMVFPAITDVTLEALCPGEDQCSLAIYLTGLQRAIIGLGALVVTPLVGNLSDKFGRKALLCIPVTSAIAPTVILAYSRSTVYFYAAYVFQIFAGIFCEGSMECLSLAYVADKVGERRRASYFGALSGIGTAGIVFGTIAARFLDTSSIFQVSAVLKVITAIHLKAFLPDSDAGVAVSEDSARPLCSSSSNSETAPTLLAFRTIPSFSDMANLLTSSATLSRVAIITFFFCLGESGLLAALLFFLKVHFQFSKNQFADLLLTTSTAGTISQLTLMPFLAQRLGEEKLLIVGLLAYCAQIFLYSIAWSYWVPYFCASLAILTVFISPSIRSMVSRKAGSTEQGLAQGCITGIGLLAGIIAPIAFTPLTAWFLSNEAPFDFKGFSILCAGFSMLAAFAVSITMWTKSSLAS
ncbi:Major facilitator superfamily protein [Rhynchospora pubera]|uniref:Major facilitator superfamily protein n=1 Tax=Rhynchospora pubera TaxID=906938 RepID=A0AAV8CWH2_9POAL|nr:Major facilitator superfamily protein [Rhynchospora pubera]